MQNCTLIVSYYESRDEETNILFSAYSFIIWFKNILNEKGDGFLFQNTQNMAAIKQCSPVGRIQQNIVQ